MKSIRALHVAAEEAERGVSQVQIHANRDLIGSYELAVLDATYALKRAQLVRHRESFDLVDAVRKYHDQPTSLNYDRLIAAALAAHATDQEATQ